MATHMSYRLTMSGVAIILASVATPAHAQVPHEQRVTSPPPSFWSWSTVSGWGGIGRLLLGNWSCSGAYADGPTLDSCGVSDVQPPHKRLVDEHSTDSKT